MNNLFVTAHARLAYGFDALMLNFEIDAVHLF
jgi:hypothetical protein